MEDNELSYDRAIVEDDLSMTMQSRLFFVALAAKLEELESRIKALENP